MYRALDGTLSRVVRNVDGVPMSPVDLAAFDRYGRTPRTRWSTKRKINAARAIAGGLLTFDEAATRWRLSREEFDEWSRLTLRDTERHKRVAAPERDSHEAARADHRTG